MISDIIIFAVILLIGLYNLTIAVLGLFPKCRACAVGTLTKSSTLKNVRCRYGGRIRYLTKYSYVYTVNGKNYRHSGEVRCSKRRLFPKTSVVYVKGFPRHAYLNKFQGVKEWTIGITFLFFDLMLVIAASR